MRIAIIGLGLVATSDALVLARQHDVVMTGPVPDRVDAINAGSYPLDDPALAEYTARHDLRLRATLDTADALAGADMVLISSPLALHPETGNYETVELESRIEMAYRMCPGVPIVIRSAVPIGFTLRMRAELDARSILYAPEFLSEGRALSDALKPDVIVVGDRGAFGSKVSAVFVAALEKPGVPVRLVGPSEAEAVKHFSQAYLAARVAFFNELDSYALTNGLDARQVIDGVCLDPRIGTFANNPCFGFGGFRLPRSTEALSKSFGGIPAHVVPTVARAGEARLSVLTAKILERGASRIGVYQPGGSAAERDPLTALRQRLEETGVHVVGYFGSEADDASLARFKAGCDLVVAQRLTPELRDIGNKVFCRDLYAH